MKAGVVWVNSTNLFDAAAGFGGYKESGFGREGGREGMYEYIVADWLKSLPNVQGNPTKLSALPAAEKANLGIDRTAKLFIGGKQSRSDSGYSYSILNAKGASIGEAALGNRKDIRNAVEAAVKANAWASATAHNRAQVLYYIAENLSARTAEFAKRLQSMGHSAKAAADEVELSIRRIFYYAAQADKFDGRVHATHKRNVTLAMNEPFGVMGLLCPDAAPLLGFVSLVMPAIAMGNRVVVVPSALEALVVTDFYQVIETSDVPAGVINIVTGDREELAKTLGDHDEVDALWYHGNVAGCAAVEKASAGNLKSTWTNNGKQIDWRNSNQGQGTDYLRHATQVKNIWIPYGE